MILIFYTIFPTLCKICVLFKGEIKQTGQNLKAKQIANCRNVFERIESMVCRTINDFRFMQLNTILHEYQNNNGKACRAPVSQLLYYLEDPPLHKCKSY